MFQSFEFWSKDAYSTITESKLPLWSAEISSFSLETAKIQINMGFFNILLQIALLNLMVLSEEEAMVRSSVLDRKETYEHDEADIQFVSSIFNNQHSRKNLHTNPHLWLNEEYEVFLISLVDLILEWLHATGRICFSRITIAPVGILILSWVANCLSSVVAYMHKV